MVDVNTLVNLKAYPPQTNPPIPVNNTLVYVKGHTTIADKGGGIFIWKDAVPVEYQINNDGTIVQSNNSNLNGRWVRLYEGYINVLFFGAVGYGGDYTAAIQKAIDFAEINAGSNTFCKSSTVYFPAGNYVITNLTLKNGVKLLGDSNFNTIFSSPGGNSGDYLFKMLPGPNFLSIENFVITGQGSQKGCFLFEALPDTSTQHGGLWSSTFRNISIIQFKGHGIYLKGGGAASNYMNPNQFNIFENVRVNKYSDYSNALKMTGQCGQFTFINCNFDGWNLSAPPSDRQATYPVGHNVNISHDTNVTCGVVTFLNCSIQDADYGIYINFGENVTFDNCWFENLGVAVTIDGSYNSCRSINILNSRFANAAGYGSLAVGTGNIKVGNNISINRSYVNVYNNYVLVSDPDSPNLSPNSSFINIANNTSGGVAVSGNTFQVNKLGKTYGIMQVVNVSSNSINCGRNKLVFVNSSLTVINTIISSISAGETLTVRANGGSISFNSQNNIFLNRPVSQPTFILNTNEIAVFIKIDNYSGSNYESFQLLSVMRISTP